MTNKKVKQLQKAYELCEEFFCTGYDIMQAGNDFAQDDHEKQEFFRVLFGYFAKKKQKELVENNVY